MAFLHCDSIGCGWSQDDFWSPDGYNPFRQDIIDWLKACLFKDIIELDGEEGHQRFTGTEFVAREIEKMAKSIRHMNIKTDDDWNKMKSEWACPRCGQKNWDID
jgi:uncharacterized protein (DUF2126 family)